MGQAKTTKFGFITTTRAHLFDMAKRVVSAIDPQQQTIVSVKGSLECGKKIIPDVAVNTLLQSPQLTVGQKCRDETWEGQGPAGPMRIHFINATGSVPYSFETPHMAPNIDIAHMFLARQKQTLPSVTFIHNGKEFEEEADLSIWLEDNLGYIVGHEATRVPNRYRHTFMKASQSRPWTRYVEIAVNSDRLKPSALAFLEQTFTPAQRGGLLKKAPQYGVNIPYEDHALVTNDALRQKQSAYELSGAF